MNALAALASGAVPAAILALYFHPRAGMWLTGVVAGLLWANWFEYAYHRFLLHWPGTFFAGEHLLHHASSGMAEEADHVNFGRSPRWIVLLFAVNGIPAVLLDYLLGWHFAPGMLVGYTVYFVMVEELHWRFHLGGWLPPGLHAAKIYHLAHHDRPNARYNVFLPLWDKLLGTANR